MNFLKKRLLLVPLSLLPISKVPDTFARGHEADSMHGAAVKAIFQMSPLKKEAPEEATEEAPQEATEEAPEEPQKKERRSQRRKSRRNGRKKKA